MEKSSPKPGTPSAVPSKTLITKWLRSLFPDLPHNLKIEDLGDGIVYCRILSHFYSNPPLQRICFHPKNEYDYINNLKHAQASLLQQSVLIPFDVNKIAKRKFLENWQLINNFYRHFIEEASSNQAPQEDNSYPGPQPNHMMHMSPAHFQTSGSKSLNKKKPQFICPPPYEPEFCAYSPRQFSYSIPHYPQSPQDLALTIKQLAQNSLNMTNHLKENMNIHNSSPSKGKWSVGSQMLQSNQSAIIDRLKEILLKASNDTEKIRQIKMLLGMPVDEEEVIKIEDDEVGQIVYEQLGDKLEESSQTKEVKLEKETFTRDANKVSLSKAVKKPFKI